MIEVTDINGYKLIRQDGLTQSCIPPYPKGYWREMLPEEGTVVEDALVLGLGAGTVCREIKDRWPDSRIDAVEHDSEMVKLARRQFKILEYVDQIYKKDAFLYVRECEKKYSLVIVDLYDGFNFSLRVISDDFINGCKHLLKEGGLLSVNVPQIDQCVAHFQLAKNSPFNRLFFFKKETLILKK